MGFVFAVALFLLRVAFGSILETFVTIIVTPSTDGMDRIPHPAADATVWERNWQFTRMMRYLIVCHIDVFVELTVKHCFQKFCVGTGSNNLVRALVQMVAQFAAWYFAVIGCRAAIVNMTFRAFEIITIVPRWILRLWRSPGPLTPEVIRGLPHLPCSRLLLSQGAPGLGSETQSSAKTTDSEVGLEPGPGSEVRKRLRSQRAPGSTRS